MERKTGKILLAIAGVLLYGTFKWLADHLLFDWFSRYLATRWHIEEADVIAHISSFVIPGLLAALALWLAFKAFHLMHAQSAPSGGSAIRISRDAPSPTTASPPLVSTNSSLPFTVRLDPKKDVHKNVPIFQYVGGPVIDYGTYVHLHVEAAPLHVVAECKGFIILVEKLDPSRGTIVEEGQTRPLVWAPRIRSIHASDRPWDTS